MLDEFDRYPGIQKVYPSRGRSVILRLPNRVEFQAVIVTLVSP